jgi:hypothetical protein
MYVNAGGPLWDRALQGDGYLTKAHSADLLLVAPPVRAIPPEDKAPNSSAWLSPGIIADKLPPDRGSGPYFGLAGEPVRI